MANGEWLTQLMAGLGGAFTGATQAKERMALEAEAKRKRQEQQMERERIAAQRKLAESLFSGPIDRDRISKFLAAGGGLQEAQLARGLIPEEPKLKPRIEERREDGGVAIYEDGNFKSWKIRPKAERETPSGPTPADLRGARTELRGAEEGYRSVMRSRPRQTQYPDMYGEPDTAAFNQALQNWRSDSTYAAQRRQGAGEELQALLKAAGGVQAGGAGMPAPASANPMRSRIELDARTKMAEIDMDPTLTFQQRQEMKRRVQAQANKFLNP